MAFDGSISGRSPSSQNLQISVSPVDRATIERKLSVGSTMSARVIESHGGGRYTVGFAGMRMMAESTMHLPEGAKMMVQVAALEPKIHLRVMEHSQRRDLDQILVKLGVSKTDGVTRELVKSMMEHNLPINRETVRQGLSLMKNGLSPRAAARFLAENVPMSKSLEARAGSADRPLTAAVDRLVNALESRGRQSEAAVIRESLTFKGDIGELFSKHPLKMERRSLAGDPSVETRRFDFGRVLEGMSNEKTASGKKMAVAQRAEAVLRTWNAKHPTPAERTVVMTKAIDGLVNELNAAGRKSEIGQLRFGLLEPATAALRDAGPSGAGLITPRSPAENLLLEARLLLSELSVEKPGNPLRIFDPLVAGQARQVLDQLSSPTPNLTALSEGIEKLVVKLVQLGREGEARRMREFAAPRVLFDMAAPAEVARGEAQAETAASRDPKGLLLALALGGQADGGAEISNAAREVLETLEGHYLFGDPQEEMPFLVDDNGAKDASISAYRKGERSYVRFRLDTSRLGEVVGVMDFKKKTFGLAIGVGTSEARKDLRRALPELFQTMSALGFTMESVTVDLDRKRVAEDEAPLLGFDIKA